MGFAEVLAGLRERAERLLTEPSALSSALGRLEERTGVGRKVLVAGTSCSTTD